MKNRPRNRTRNKKSNAKILAVLEPLLIETRRDREAASLLGSLAPVLIAHGYDIQPRATASPVATLTPETCESFRNRGVVVIDSINPRDKSAPVEAMRLFRRSYQDGHTEVFPTLDNPASGSLCETGGYYGGRREWFREPLTIADMIAALPKFRIGMRRYRDAARAAELRVAIPRGYEAHPPRLHYYDISSSYPASMLPKDQAR